MKSAFDNSFEKYNVEDGHFCLAAEIDDKTKENVENLGVKLYKNFYKNEEIKNGHTLRLYRNRDDFNKISVFEGNLPENNGEIAIDRLYAENNEIKVGDKLLITGPTTGAMYVTLDEARVDLKPVDVVKKGVHVSFKVPDRIRPSDRLYSMVPAEELKAKRKE